MSKRSDEPLEHRPPTRAIGSRHAEDHGHDPTGGLGLLQADAMPTVWYVAEDYYIEDGCVVEGMGLKKAVYSPADSPQVFADFLTLGTADDSEILTFAKKWGLLGQERAVARGRARPPEPARDHLGWIRAHAAGVALCERLIRLMAAEDLKGVSDCLASFPDAGPPQEDPGDTRRLRKRGRTEQAFVHGVKGEVRTTLPLGMTRGIDPALAARLVLSWVINPNLAGIGLQLQFQRSETEEPRLALGSTFGALVDVMYWRLARLLQGSDRVERCAWCGRPFIPRDVRQRYCPHPVDPDRFESTCARSAREQRRRRKGNDETRPR